MLIRIRVANVGILAMWVAVADVQAQECTGPDLDIRITRRATAGTANCFQDVTLSGPGTVGPVECPHPFDQSIITSTGSATISQTSSRIEINASASTRFPGGFNSTASGSGIVTLVFNGVPVQLTITNRSKTVTNGVVVSENNSPPQTLLLSEDNPVVQASGDCGAITLTASQGGADSTCSGVVLTIDIEPLSVANATQVEFHWINPAGGSYVVGSNWDPACIPVHNGVRSDTAIFDLNTGSPIPINAAAATAGQWRVLNGTYNISGPAEVFATHLFDEASLEIADGGYLMLTGSTLTSVDTFIGLTGGSSIMDVTNSGTTLQNANVITIANGFLDVTAGGQVTTDELVIGMLPGDVGRVRSNGVFAGTSSGVQAAGTLKVGDSGSGTLTVLDGAFARADEITVGVLGTGTVLVKGSSNPGAPLDTAAFAQLVADSFLTIGGAGQGTLTVEKGGVAQAEFVIVGADGTGTGRVIVDGQGELAKLTASESLTVVATEQVEVEVKNGGLLLAQSVSLGSVSVRPGAADLTIRGNTTQQDPAQQSRLRVFDIPSTPGPAGLTSVGGLAEGQLNILDGGQASLEGGLMVGENARGVVVVSMPLNVSFTTASTLTVTGETRVGNHALGFLTVNNGIMNNVGDLRIGFFNGQSPSSFSVDVSEVHVQGALAIGVTGPGALTIRDSDPSRGVPTPECQTLLVGGSTPQAIGTVSLVRSTLLISGNAQIGVGAGGGQLAIDEESTIRVNGTMTIGGPVGGIVLVEGLLQGGGTVVVVPNGRLEGNGTVTAPKVDAGGYIAPGLSPGTLTIDGDLEQLPGGLLEMEYTGLNAGEFDVLHVTGQTTLGGRLEIHFRGGFSPDDPEGFVHSQDFVEADQGIIGDYDERVFVFPDLFADFDEDGDKDLRDVAAFANCFAESGALSVECQHADWERDGVVGGREIMELAGRLGGPH